MKRIISLFLFLTVVLLNAVAAEDRLRVISVETDNSSLNLIVLKNGLSLFALPMARREKDFTAQVRTLVKLSGYLKEKEEKYRFPLIIWVASSNRAVLEGMERVKRIKEWKDIPISYVLDYNTKAGNPMNQIYSMDLKGGSKAEISRILL